MANEIKLKRGSGSDPTASDLVVGEVAVRTDTGKLFTKKDDNSIAEISGGIDDGDKGDITVSNSGATFTIDSGVINNAKVASDAAIAGSKVDPDFGSQNIETTGTLSSASLTLSNNNLIINGSAPQISFVDSNANDDFLIKVNGGIFDIRDSTDDASRFSIDSNGNISAGGTITSTFSGNLTGNVTGNTSGSSGSCTGNAATATALATARNIAGVSFDGTANISLNNNAITNGAGYITDLVNDTSPQLGGDLASNGNNINMADDDIINVGSSNDLRIRHNGSNSIIEDVGTGNLLIRGDDVHITGTNDELMAKFVENGQAELYHNNSKKAETVSGGFTVTGTCTATAFSGPLTGNVTGNASGSSGSCTGNAATATALETARTIAGVSFDGTGNISLNNNAITNGAGYITDVVNDTSPQLGGDLQSNGNNIDFADNDKAFFGSSNDMLIEHDGSHSYIDNNTGDLIIRCDGDDVKILAEDDVVIRDNNDSTNMLRCVNGGAVELYHNGSLMAQTAADGLEITGSLTTQNIDCTHATLNIQNGGGSKTAAAFNPAAGQFFYHNHTLKLNTASTGITVSGRVACDGADLGNSETILLGNSDEFQIFYDGTHARLDYLGSGSLQNKIKANSYFQVVNRDTGDNMIQAQAGGDLEFYHAGSKKAETVSGGFTITGTCTATAFSGDGSALTNLPSSGLPLSGGELTGDLITHVVKPDGNGTRSLGTSSLRWSDVFTSDLHLSNKGSSNKVDNSWGDFTIQEGMEDLFLINNRNGKMYKFVLKEVG